MSEKKREKQKKVDGFEKDGSQYDYFQQSFNKIFLGVSIMPSPAGSRRSSSSIDGSGYLNTERPNTPREQEQQRLLTPEGIEVALPHASSVVERQFTRSDSRKSDSSGRSFSPPPVWEDDDFAALLSGSKDSVVEGHGFDEVAETPQDFLSSKISSADEMIYFMLDYREHLKGSDNYIKKEQVPTEIKATSVPLCKKTQLGNFHANDINKDNSLSQLPNPIDLESEEGHVKLFSGFPKIVNLFSDEEKAEKYGNKIYCDGREYGDRVSVCVENMREEEMQGSIIRKSAGEFSVSKEEQLDYRFKTGKLNVITKDASDAKKNVKTCSELYHITNLPDEAAIEHKSMYQILEKIGPEKIIAHCWSGKGRAAQLVGSRIIKTALEEASQAGEEITEEFAMKVAKEAIMAVMENRSYSCFNREQTAEIYHFALYAAQEINAQKNPVA